MWGGDKERMENINLIPYIILTVVIAGIIAGAGAITLAEFEDTTSDADALNAIGNASSGVTTVAEQIPTVAIISVMVIIISVIAGVFAYFRFFR